MRRACSPLPGRPAAPALGRALRPPRAAGRRAQARGEGAAANVEQRSTTGTSRGARRARELPRSVARGHRAAATTSHGRVAFEEGRYADAVKLLEAAGRRGQAGQLPAAREGHAAPSPRTTQTRGERALHLHLPAGQGRGAGALRARGAGGACAPRWRRTSATRRPEKMRVEVVNNARELAKVSHADRRSRSSTTGTIAICKFNKLMVTSPKAVARGYDWLDTLAHEYMHLVVSQKSRNTVPIWLHEGLAKYLESRWRGPGGLAMTPSTLALLGERVKKNKLVPFEKMHPSMALLPTAEDAATAFAEVFFAIDYVYHKGTAGAARPSSQELATGQTDQQAVEAATGMPFPPVREGVAGPRARSSPSPRSSCRRERVVLKEDAKAPARRRATRRGGRSPSATSKEVDEVPARASCAHLGELMRERNRVEGRRGGVRARRTRWWATGTSRSPTSTRSRCWSCGGWTRRRRCCAARSRCTRAAPRRRCTWAASAGRGVTGGPGRRTWTRWRRTPSTPRSTWRCSSRPSRSAITPLADRAGKGSSILTGVPADRLPELLARLPGPQSDPSDVTLPRAPAEPSRPPRPAPKKGGKASEPTATERL